MKTLEPNLARALGNTLLDLLPEYELGRCDVARQAGVGPEFVESLYKPGTPVDASQVVIPAAFLGIDVLTFAANARLALD